MSTLPRIFQTTLSPNFLRTAAGCLIAVAFSWLTGFAAQAQDGKKDKDIDDKTIYAIDNWPLKLTYYKSSAGKEAAVVVLLHQKRESRMVWTAKGGVAETLHGEGFAVIAVDLRKHGESKPGGAEEEPKKSTADKDKSAKKSAGGELKKEDYVGMVLDMEAVKKFIFEEHQKGNLNMRKMAIVAPAMSAAVAIVFTARDWEKKPYDDASTPAARTPRGQDVQSLVFLSPETNLPGLAAHQVMPVLKNFPIASLVVVGKDDSAENKDQAKKLFQQLGGDPAKIAPAKKSEPAKKTKDKEADSHKDDKDKVRHYYQEPPGKLRGTDMLGKKLGIEGDIVVFLKHHMKDLKGPFYEWRDRQSRLTD